jgi:hypothetical protein
MVKGMPGRKDEEGERGMVDPAHAGTRFRRSLRSAAGKRHELDNGESGRTVWRSTW